MAKVTDEELKEVQELRDSLLTIVSSIGELHLAKVLLEKEISLVFDNIKTEEENFSKFQEKERVVYSKLQEKYGAGNINLETGEITV